MKFPESEELFPSGPALQVYNTWGDEIPLNDDAHQRILELIQRKENIQFKLVEVVYVDNNEIQKINKEHLNRDYITDIISFRYDDDTGNRAIEGTLYCCAPRIIEQADEYGFSHAEEFSRILVHGLLHLIGYDDESEEDKRAMTGREDHYLLELGL